MRIAHFFSGNPNSGAASGALNLCKGILKHGLTIKIFNDVFDFKIENKSIFFKKKKFYQRINSYKNNLIDRSIFFPIEKKIKFSSGIIGEKINYSQINNEFDVVHFHWINNGFIDIRNFSKITRPIVWTIRDMWPFTGGCHYTLGCNKFTQTCEKCPNIKSYFPKIDQVNKYFKLKKNTFDNLNLHIVPISKWLEKEIVKSKILKNHKITQIYNCIDDEFFFPENMQSARKELNLPLNKIIVLIGSQNLNDDIKDNQEILKLIHQDFKKYYFISFGKNSENFKNFKNYGFIEDKNKLRKIYSASNVFVSLAKQEAFGKVIVESLMCNTPVLAKQNDSNSEMIYHLKNGYIFNQNKNFKDGMEWIITNLNKNNIINKKLIDERFELSLISKHYINLYKKILFK